MWVCSTRPSFIRLRRWEVCSQGGKSRPQLPPQVGLHVPKIFGYGLNAINTFFQKAFWLLRFHIFMYINDFFNLYVEIIVLYCFWLQITIIILNQLIFPLTMYYKKFKFITVLLCHTNWFCKKAVSFCVFWFKNVIKIQQSRLRGLLLRRCLNFGVLLKEIEILIIEFSKIYYFTII